MMSELPNDLKNGNWANIRWKFSSVGVNINCLLKEPANISVEDLNAVKYIHTSGNNTPISTSEVITQNNILLMTNPAVPFLFFTFHLLSC